MPSHPAQRADASVLEQVIAAVDDGVLASVEELARVVQAPEADLRSALDALDRYSEQIAREQAHALTATRRGTTEVLPQGKRIGPYVLDSMLGCGGMGVVYRAHQTTLGDRAVALKVLPAALANRDPRFVERFHREATLAAAIHHPNLAEVYGFEADDDTLCFAMRLVEGPTLHDVLVALAQEHEGPVRPTSEERVRRCVILARAIGDGLAQLHARGLVHRDVKPSNVMLEHARGGSEAMLLARPVLVDFGLLRPAGDSVLTGSATLIGTPAYASHDSLLGRELDARADVFSLAVTLYDLLTSTSPETRAQPTAGMPDVRAINPTVDARLAAILSMALQEQKELRYEHAGALRDELDRWLRSEPLRAAPSHTLGKMRLWARRNPVRAAKVIAVVAAAVLPLAAIAAWFTWIAIDLTATANAAAGHERQGDLIGAAEAYRDLLEGEAARLPWLLDDVERARNYWSPNGSMQLATQHLLAARTAQARGDIGAPDVAREWQRASFILVERLLDDRDPTLVGPISRFLVRGADHSSSAALRIAALDALTDYLVVQELPQHVPDGLVELLRETLFGADAAALPAAVRTAAIAALAAIRRVEAFVAIVDVLQCELSENDADIAAAGSTYLYRWLHVDSRAAAPTIGRDLHDRIGKTVLERWGLNCQKQRQRHDIDPMVGCVARHLAWWEKAPEGAEPPRARLELPQELRDRVDAAHTWLASRWQEGRESILNATNITPAHPYAQYLVASGRFVDTFEAVVWQPLADEDNDVELGTAVPDPTDERGAVRFRKDGGVELSGTISRAVSRAGELEDWESDARDGFLKLVRPGHSQLRIRSCVPRDAHALRIVVTQMIGRRPVVRSGGVVAFRLHLEGLAQKVESIVCDNNRYGRDPDRCSDWQSGAKMSVDVPLHVLGDRTEIEVTLAYLYGNTTWRLLGVELLWNPPEPR